MHCLAASPSEKSLGFRSKSSSTSGGNEMQEKDELYRRPGALVSNQNLDFVDQVPNAANHPDFPFTASSLGERLIEKDSRPRAIPRACLLLAPRSTSTRRIAAEITASMAASTSHGSASRESPRAPTVETSSNLRFAGFPSDYAPLPTVAFVIPNLNHDMHNSKPAQSIPAADAWLRANLGGYYQWAKTHHSLLIVTFDEYDAKDKYPCAPSKRCMGCQSRETQQPNPAGAGIADETIAQTFSSHSLSPPATPIITLCLPSCPPRRTPPR
jgi:Phosphoesterase family